MLFPFTGDHSRGLSRNIEKNLFTSSRIIWKDRLPQTWVFKPLVSTWDYHKSDFLARECFNELSLKQGNFGTLKPWYGMSMAFIGPRLELLYQCVKVAINCRCIQWLTRVCGNSLCPWTKESAVQDFETGLKHSPQKRFFPLCSKAIFRGVSFGNPFFARRWNALIPIYPRVFPAEALPLGFVRGVWGDIFFLPFPRSRPEAPLRGGLPSPAWGGRNRWCHHPASSP